jgi:hypothetical protein
LVRWGNQALGFGWCRVYTLWTSRLCRNEVELCMGSWSYEIQILAVLTSLQVRVRMYWKSIQRAWCGFSRRFCSTPSGPQAFSVGLQLTEASGYTAHLRRSSIIPTRDSAEKVPTCPRIQVRFIDNANLFRLVRLCTYLTSTEMTQLVTRNP